MTQRQRKLAGTVALIVLIFAYAMLALAVAVVLQVQNANKLVELLYYVIAGLLWVLPAGIIITWMQRQDQT
jgi:peptidoglycan/LPS O-acetylase OafA/YrhL